DIFYQDMDVYESQKRLDDLVEDICCFIQATRFQLHIHSTCRGLLYDVNSCSVRKFYFHFAFFGRKGTTIPHDISEIKNVTSTARFILIIEKDATFQQIVNSDFAKKHSALLVTGKGFPDSNTRQIVRIFWEFLRIPIFVLVDADSYGIEILCVYRYGSLGKSYNAINLVNPQIRWLGVHPTDLNGHIISKTTIMSDADIKKIQDLLNRPYIKSNPIWREQVQHLLNLKAKAEIQILTNYSSQYLINEYIPNKIKNGNWL
ncbi:meiotic recombination protein SPO11-like isoform X4, partial [Dinothrombium tinctorium]